MSKQVNKITGEVVKSVAAKGGWTTITYVDGKSEKVRNGAVAGLLEAMADSKHDTDEDTAKAKEKVKREPRTTEPYIRRVMDATYDLRDYDRVKSAAGNLSLDSGDDVAIKLRGKTIDEVFAIVAYVTAYPEKDLRARYGHMNVGMQRMCLGNVVRGHEKRHGKIPAEAWK